MLGGEKDKRKYAFVDTSQSIIIDFVAAGDVTIFKASESWSIGAVLEMPVHVSDIFLEA